MTIVSCGDMRFRDIILDTVFPPRETELVVRGLTKDQLLTSLSPVLIEGATIHGLFPYTDVRAQACVVETKFHDNISAASFLGSALAEFLYEELSANALFIRTSPILIPIPLSPVRRAERGYNQAERIAQKVVALLPHCHIDVELLTRTRNTFPQTSLSGARRRENMRNAFGTSRPCAPEHTYIVIDDVSTTGSTMRAACKALEVAGATHILPIALAYAQ